MVDDQSVVRTSYDGDALLPAPDREPSDTTVDSSPPSGTVPTALSARIALPIPGDSPPGRHSVVAILYDPIDLHPLVEAVLGSVLVTASR